MQRSECVLIERHTPAECLRNKELYDTLVPDECHRLRQAYFDCRRGWVTLHNRPHTDFAKLDMRLRFRGNAPIRGSNREAEMNTLDEKERPL